MSQYLKEVLADAPVGYWPLDDWKHGPQPTQAKDASGNNLHSVDWANIARAPGPFGGLPAGRFNGSTSGMTIPGSALLDLQTFTIEAWVAADKVSEHNGSASAPFATQYGFIFEKTTNGSVNTQYAFFFEEHALVGRSMTSTTDYSHATGNSINTFAHDIPVGRWTHLCFRRRASDGYNVIAKNGNAIRDRYMVGTLPTNPAGTSFIGVYGGGGYRFKGAIAHVAVYPSFLSDARIAAHLAAAGRDSVAY